MRECVMHPLLFLSFAVLNKPVACSMILTSTRSVSISSMRRTVPSMGPLQAIRDRFKSSPSVVKLPPPVAFEAAEAVECELDKPETCEEPKLVMSSTDKILVKLGMKTEGECKLEPEGENLMEKIKCAGRAGIISYILWEWAFWIGAGGVAAFTYYTATGSWPDLSNPEDQGKVAASAFALVNVARFAVPLRIGLALSTVPWVDDNIVKPFLVKGDAAP
jgi:hypothetical protein